MNDAGEAKTTDPRHHPIGGMGRLNEFQIAMAKNLFDEEPFDAEWYQD